MLVDNDIIKCFICKWIFPNEMNGDDKNTHISLCLDGKGQTDKDNYAKCMVCGWVYPSMISAGEKNAHVNHCIDDINKGKEHRDNYIKSMKVASVVTSDPKMKNLVYIHDIDVCPTCDKQLNNIKDKNRHITDCMKKQDNLNRKRRR